MHNEFIKYGTPSVKLIEECSELIKAVCKGERFGYDDVNPLVKDSKTNRENLYLEIADVELAIKNFKEFLDNLPKDIKRKFEYELPPDLANWSFASIMEIKDKGEKLWLLEQRATLYHDDATAKECRKELKNWGPARYL